MSRTLAIAVLASAPTLAAADATTDYIHKLEAIVQSLQTRVDIQTDFVSSLSDSIDTGIGRLVDDL